METGQLIEIGKRINKCRISGSQSLQTVVNLGTQALTGVFPFHSDEEVAAGPLELVWCAESGLLQLSHDYDKSLLYGNNYGYRSGLNDQMIGHLTNTVYYLLGKRALKNDDVVLDIGSNDGTLLSKYPKSCVKIGIDPTAEKFSEFYDDDVIIVPKFFSKESFFEVSSKKASFITSISMFYDLQDPLAFVSEIKEILADDGIWFLEQSYMPAMVDANAYDTICHEHLEYYSLSNIEFIVAAVGLKIIDVSFNAVNGGSFSVLVAHDYGPYRSNDPVITWVLERESRIGVNTAVYYKQFQQRVRQHRKELVQLITRLVDDGKTIGGYGASTKGNVLLQYCNFDQESIFAIGEINKEKFGKYTPGSKIPIIPERELIEMRPDYIIVFPWHFRDYILNKEREFLEGGGRIIFPLPNLEIY